MMRRALAALAMLALSVGVAEGQAPEKPQDKGEKPPPFLLPLLDGDKGRTHQPPAGRLAKAATPDPRKLFDMAVDCWPAKSFMRAEINLEARVNKRTGDGSTTTLNTTDGLMESRTGGGEKYVGLVAKIPLYSSLELDREREREAGRRTKIAEAIGGLLGAISENELNKRQLALSRALEKRAQERVGMGVAETGEQVGYLKEVAKLEGESYKLRAGVTKARLTIVGMCEDGPRANFVDDYIKEFTKGIE